MLKLYLNGFHFCFFHSSKAKKYTDVTFEIGIPHKTATIQYYIGVSILIFQLPSPLWNLRK